MQTGRQQTAYGQVRESQWQSCLTGWVGGDGGWWRQRQYEWQGEAEGKGEAVTHEGRGSCGWQTAAGGDDQLTWHIGSYHCRALAQTEGEMRVRGRVMRATPLTNGQTSVGGRLRNRKRQARCKVKVAPYGISVCLSPNFFLSNYHTMLEHLGFTHAETASVQTLA